MVNIPGKAGYQGFIFLLSNPQRWKPALARGESAKSLNYNDFLLAFFCANVALPFLRSEACKLGRAAFWVFAQFHEI